MDEADAEVARIAAAIGEPARALILFSLLDGCARTSTELSVVAEVAPSTASAHLARLRAARLVEVVAQGRHRYHRLAGPDVAAALESLAVLAASARRAPASKAPLPLREARTCYDHAAGRFGVAIHDALLARSWLAPVGERNDYAPTAEGAEELQRLGIDLEAIGGRRRRFACACLDWSERRPHLGGALGAALLALALSRGWITRDLDSRVLQVTPQGRRRLQERLGADACG